MRKNYKNPSADALPVYADSKMTQKIGDLSKGGSCQCIGEQDGAAIVLYKVLSSGVYKVGFADPKGVQG